MNVSLKNRINYGSVLLVCLFIINALVSILILLHNKKLSIYIDEIEEPLLQNLQEFKEIIDKSKMHSINWVFLPSNKGDKDSLIKIINVDYSAVKTNITGLSTQLKNRSAVSSLNSIHARVNELFLFEDSVITTLKTIHDYKNPFKKIQCIQLLEKKIIPQTEALKILIDKIILNQEIIRAEDEKYFFSSWELIKFIISLCIAFILITFLLSRFLTRIIITPINQISSIINNLSKGIIEVIERDTKDEIGEMMQSVNALSKKLQRTANFAEEVGNTNFDTYFEPVGKHDILGKALVKMRDDLKENNIEMNKVTNDLIDRNNDLEQFTYIVSHNLRAPVANIMGISDLINSISGDSTIKDEEQLMTSLSVSVKKLDEIILDLNDILKARATLNERKEVISLSFLVEDIRVSIAHILQTEGVIINSDFSAASQVFSSKSYMYSIFYNLISNSIKYRQDGVSPVIHITSYYADSKIHLTFKDNGRGIDLNKNSREIFGLYKRFDYSIDGKGMGLFMVKTHVKTMGGTITVKSQLNKGSEFCLSFPAAEILAENKLQKKGSIRVMKSKRTCKKETSTRQSHI